MKYTSEMSRKRRTLSGILCLILAAVLVLSCTACGGGENEGDEGSDTEGQVNVSHAGNPVKYPAGVKFLEKNRLTTETVSVNTDCSERSDEYPSPYEYSQMSPEEKISWDPEEVYFMGSYVKISGLKDKEVEAKVNDKLLALFTENIDKLPPYRGILAELGENPKKGDGYVNVEEYVSFNSNNILSVVLSSSRNYRSARSGEDVYVNFEVPLNIDLNTGEEINIIDLFCDDTDAFSYLNEQVGDSIRSNHGDEEVGEYYFYGELKIDRPFTGLQHDQKYSIFDGGLQLYFDYNTPEFVMSGFHDMSLTLPFGKETAIADRFYKKGENIYVSKESPTLYFPYNGGENETICFETGNVAGYPDLSYSRVASCDPGTPDLQRKEMFDFVNGVTAEEMLKDVSERVPEGVPSSDVGGYYDFNSYSEIIGPYLTVTEHADCYIVGMNTDGGYTTYYSDYSDNSLTYDLRSKSSKPDPIELQDIFKKGVDYEETIKEAVMMSINSEINNSNAYRADDEPEQPMFRLEAMDDITTERAEQNRRFLDSLYDHIKNVKVQYDGIVLDYGEEYPGDYGTPEALYKEIYGEDPYDNDNYTYLNGARNLKYEMFDCSKLSIFDY